MSIEAMKIALAALESCAPADTSSGHVIYPSFDEKLVDQAYEAIHNAIQQAESEPVGFVDFQGTVFWHDGPPPADSLLFAAKPVSHDKAKWCEYVAGMVFAWLEMQENLKEEDRCIKAIAGIIERRMWALPTHHPAPGVPDDVVRDAERYRWLRKSLPAGQGSLTVLLDDRCNGAFHKAVFMESLDASIDAAMLAASQAQKVKV